MVKNFFRQIQSNIWHSVHWGINPSPHPLKNTPPPSFLPTPPPLNLQIVQAPSLVVFHELPPLPKSWSFQ